MKAKSFGLYIIVFGFMHIAFATSYAATIRSMPVTIAVRSQPTGALYYVRADATGSNNGLDWVNAYTSLPTTLVRGATYYVADGSYSGYTFDDAPSSTKLITLKKATTVDHGTNTGWVSSLGDGQVSFQSLSFLTGYYEISGQTRDENNWQNIASYGFRLPGGISISPGVTNLTAKYVDMGGNSGQVYPNVPSNGVHISTMGGAYRSHITLHRVHIHNVGTPFHSRGTHNLTLEYSHIGPGFSKEAISHQYGDNWVVRYNKFIDSCVFPAGEGCTAIIGVFNFSGGGDPNDTKADNWEIYGNVFANSGLYDSASSDGMISAGIVHNWKFFNNTIHGVSGRLAGQVNINGTGHLLLNNIWHKMGRYDDSYGSYVGAGGANFSWCFYNSDRPPRGEPPNDCTALPGTVFLGSEDPFVSAATLNFRLKATFAGVSPVNKGESLKSYIEQNPTKFMGTLSDYARDADGRIRGADGAWDIGAFER